MRINLLPAELRPQPVLNPKRLFLIILGILVIIAELGFMGNQYLQFTTETTLLNNTIQQLDSLKDTKESIQKAELKRQNILKQKEEISNIRSQYLPYLTHIQQVAAMIKDDVWLTNITISDKNVNLRGSTVAFPFIGDILKNLISVKSFEKVRLKNVSEVSDELFSGYDFEIDIAIRGGSPSNGKGQENQQQ